MPSTSASCMIRKTEQVRRPLARLDVFERNVVHRLAGRVGMADVLQHQLSTMVGCRSRSQPMPSVSHQERAHCRSVCSARAEARHRVPEDVAAWPAEPVNARTATIAVWVESSPPEMPMTARRSARRDEPLGRGFDLDVIDFVGNVRPVRGIGRHVGKRSTCRSRECDPAGMSSSNSSVLKCGELRRMGLHAIAERRPAHALLAQVVEVEVGCNKLLRAAESVAIREHACRSRRSCAWPSQATSVVDSPDPAAE